ncbi:MAG: ABC transporter permease [Candidatus Eremiobacteraeota bacterium]|nr:ABC transporter permease [Candidatus Eremiobacteraeota bacterium]MCW5868085.1 ABC transporter permease [Candidatus Eremiobacteraeota bacterium]
MNAYRLYISWLTLTRKEVMRVLRIWTQTLLPPAITMGIYFVVFGSFLGGQIKEIEGYPYIQFILPGLVMMTCITNSFSNVASSFFSAKFMRHIEEMLVSPMPDWVMVTGFVAGGVVRGVICGLIVALVGLFFTHIPIYNFLIIAFYLLASASLFSLAGLLNALMARKFDDISIVPTFVLTPLTYFAGTFYSIQMLPETWKKISLANPIFYMVDGFRYGFLGVHDASLMVGVVLLGGLNLVGLALSMHMVKKGVGLRS